MQMYFDKIYYTKRRDDECFWRISPMKLNAICIFQIKQVNKKAHIDNNWQCVCIGLLMSTYCHLFIWEIGIGNCSKASTVSGSEGSVVTRTRPCSQPRVGGEASNKWSYTCGHVCTHTHAHTHTMALTTTAEKKKSRTLRTFYSWTYNWENRSSQNIQGRFSWTLRALKQYLDLRDTMTGKPWTGKTVNLFKNKKVYRDFPGGAVVMNPPANAGDTSSSLGLGRSHMPRNN